MPKHIEVMLCDKCGKPLDKAAAVKLTLQEDHYVLHPKCFSDMIKEAVYDSPPRVLMEIMGV